MGQKEERKRMRALKRLALRSPGSLKLASLVVDDDGALLPCAVNATCAAVVDAGIPLKNLAVAICCCLAENGDVLLDPSKLEEQAMKAFVSLVFPNSNQSINSKGSKAEKEKTENGIITCTTHGAMLVGYHG